jgi:hypothetical protein
MAAIIAQRIVQEYCENPVESQHAPGNPLEQLEISAIQI